MNGLVVSILIILAGLVVLIVTSNIAVRKIVRLCDHFGWSKTFAGLTIFAIVTSFPEIFAHISASLGILTQRLNYEIASATVLGANIGSDVIQQTFLLGLVVLLMGGLTFKRIFLWTAYVPMILTTLLCIVLGFDGTYSRLDGGILLGTFVVYMYFLYTREHFVKRKIPKDGVRVLNEAIVALVCMAVMLVSAHFLFLAAERLVSITGLGGSLIGVVSLGVASASPELFTALSGLKQKAAGLSLGTIIGSNIVNPLVAIGGGALLSTYWVPRPLIYWDLAMETITAALLLVYLIRSKGKLGRYGAVYLMGLYFFYLFIRITVFSMD